MRRYMRLKKHLTSFQIIIMGFAGVILAGAFLLMLPFSSTSGKITPFFDALFTSTSAVCVTGLVVVDSGSYWTMFGQAVILLLIQIGGLGVITIAVAFAMLSGKKISLMQRSVMQSAISAPHVGGRLRLTRFILGGTFTYRLQWKWRDQYNDYAINHHRWNRLSDMGRHLSESFSVEEIPVAE